MVNWPQILVRNWEDFTKKIAQLGAVARVHSASLFRGQSSRRWSLVPKMCREIGEEVNEAELLGLESKAVGEFKSQAHLYLSAGELPTSGGSFLNWWMLMQHHNAPTRLLDWSRSPYVAAYFAVIDHWDQPGAVWCFDHTLLDKFMMRTYGELFKHAIRGERRFDRISLDTSSPRMLFSVEREIKSTRMVAQQGVSTACARVVADHAEIISRMSAQRSGTKPYVKLIIPAQCKESFMLQLRAMNITAGSLFPGIDGLGRSIDEFLGLELRRISSHMR